MPLQPLVFEPIFKRICWGGRRLQTVLGKPIGPEGDYAESWEISDHGDDQSIVRYGPDAGRSLSDLMQRQKLPLLGRTDAERFPLLAKFLDAADALSVQVHPDDARARQIDPSENGKTEAWVILQADPHSRLYVGLRDGVTPEELRAAAAAADVEPLLHRVDVKPGDCVFIPSGTVHSIGAGILLAEIQQTSDITFRLHDWNRQGPDGQPRALHVEQALGCIDFDRGPVDPVVPRRVEADHSLEELVGSEYFGIRRHHAVAGFSLADDKACHILMVLGGSGRLSAGDARLELPLGQSVLLPAQRDSVRIQPHGEITLLDATPPSASR